MKRITAIMMMLVGTFCVPKASGQDYSFKWNGSTEIFANGVSNLVSYIDFGDARLWGYVEITLTHGYNFQNTTGMYGKRFNIGRNSDAPMYSNTSEVFAALGPVANQWKLGEFEVNSANHLVLPIYHLANTGNLINVNITGISVVAYDVANIQLTTPQVLANTQSRDYQFSIGPVAIGTNKIDSDTKLTVGGKVTAREIKVSVGAGADFVFEPDYKNMSITELEVYLKQHKHLPEIPAAAEMQKSGLEMGAFQIKLLQKIEELTLHLIEKDKELQQQRSRITKLEEMVKQILEKTTK